MARRRSNNEQGVSMDSLMDALTNVVAVLIVILILLQIDVGQTVERLLNELEPATEEQLAMALDQKQSLLEQISQNKERLNEPEPTAQELKKIAADISLLEKSLKEHEVELLALAELKKRIEAETSSEAAERKKTEMILTEISRLKALLDETPEPKALETIEVRIPNSRDIPDSSPILYCYVFQDQIHFIDSVQGRKNIMDEIKRNDRPLLREVKKIKGKADLRIYDQEKVVRHFAEKKLMVRNHLIKVPYNKTGFQLTMRIDFDPSKGEASLADMEEASGRFHNICRYVRSVPRSVLFFRVHPNSFATYLKAREIADTMNIPCGWEVAFNPQHSEVLDFRVNQLEARPPQAPNPAPKLKRKLD